MIEQRMNVRDISWRNYIECFFSSPLNTYDERWLKVWVHMLNNLNKNKKVKIN